MAESAGPKGRSWLRVVGVLLALSFLWYALAQVTLGDRLVLSHGPEGASQVSWEGNLEIEEGNWRGTSMRGVVRSSPDNPLPGAFSELAGVVESGAALEIELNGDGSGAVNGLALREVQVRPGLVSILRSADANTLPLGLAALLLATLCISTRWWLLLRAADCATTWFSALRITYTGLFFNVILPGVSGGDLARGWIAARGHADRRSAAVATVIADRVFGLWAMTLVAVAAVSTGDDAFASLRLPVAAAAAGLTFLWVVYSLEAPRRWLRVEERLGRLQKGAFLVDFDRVGRDLAMRPRIVLGALGLSVANHLVSALAIFWLARGLGEEVSFHSILVISTVANTLSAIPLAPGGLGVGELLFGGLFRMGGGSWALGVGTSLAWRLELLGLGLLGGLVSLLPGGRAMRQEFRAVAIGSPGPGGSQTEADLPQGQDPEQSEAAGASPEA